MLKNYDDAEEKRWENRYQALTNYVSDSIAMYIVCAANDIAYLTEIQAESWTEYKRKLKKKKAGNLPAFRSGVVDIRTAIKESYDNQQRWVAEWGIGSEDNPYTPDDYRRLDEIFSTLASRPERSGGMDTLQDFNLHMCAKYALLEEKCIARGTKDDLIQAEKASNIKRRILEDELLRKKDVVPWQEITLDGVVDKLRKEGLSAEMGFDEVMRYITKQLRKEGRYSFDVDAAEHMLLCIQNTIRLNNDEPELDELPENMRFDKELHTQFAPEPNETQTQVYEHLGLKRFPWNELQPKKKGGKS